MTRGVGASLVSIDFATAPQTGKGNPASTTTGVRTVRRKSNRFRFNVLFRPAQEECDITGDDYLPGHSGRLGREKPHQCIGTLLSHRLVKGLDWNILVPAPRRYPRLQIEPVGRAQFIRFGDLQARSSIFFLDLYALLGINVLRLARLITKRRRLAQVNALVPVCLHTERENHSTWQFIEVWDHGRRVNSPSDPLLDYLLGRSRCNGDVSRGALVAHDYEIPITGRIYVLSEGLPVDTPRRPKIRLA